MATLLTMRQLVSRRLDQALVTSDIPTEAANTSFWKREEINDWLNEAYRQMWSVVAEVEAKNLVTETDGTYTANARSMSLQTRLLCLRQ